MTKSYEFHFQEGFIGETVTLLVDGKKRVQFEARTRLQTGLAQIKKLNLNPRQTVTIAVAALGLRSDYQITKEDRWLTINLVDQVLIIQATQQSPGYL